MSVGANKPDNTNKTKFSEDNLLIYPSTSVLNKKRVNLLTYPDTILYKLYKLTIHSLSHKY